MHFDAMRNMYNAYKTLIAYTTFNSNNENKRFNVLTLNNVPLHFCRLSGIMVKIMSIICQFKHYKIVQNEEKTCLVIQNNHVNTNQFEIIKIIALIF